MPRQPKTTDVAAARTALITFMNTKLTNLVSDPKIVHDALDGKKGLPNPITIIQSGIPVITKTYLQELAAKGFEGTADPEQRKAEPDQFTVKDYLAYLLLHQFGLPIADMGGLKIWQSLSQPEQKAILKEHIFEKGERDAIKTYMDFLLAGDGLSNAPLAPMPSSRTIKQVASMLQAPLNVPRTPEKIDPATAEEHDLEMLSVQIATRVLFGATGDQLKETYTNLPPEWLETLPEKAAALKGDGDAIVFQQEILKKISEPGVVRIDASVYADSAKSQSNLTEGNNATSALLLPIISQLKNIATLLPSVRERI